MSGGTYACTNFSGQPKFRKAASAKTVANFIAKLLGIGAPWEKILLVIFFLGWEIGREGRGLFLGKKRKNKSGGWIENRRLAFLEKIHCAFENIPTFVRKTQFLHSCGGFDLSAAWEIRWMVLAFSSFFGYIWSMCKPRSGAWPVGIFFLLTTSEEKEPAISGLLDVFLGMELLPLPFELSGMRWLIKYCLRDLKVKTRRCMI